MFKVSKVNGRLVYEVWIGDVWKVGTAKSIEDMMESIGDLI